MKELKFWEWFKEHKSEYSILDTLDDDKKEDLLSIFLDRLHKYNEKLFFQIGSDDKSSVNELIITAEGDVNYFDSVSKLVDAAPKIDGWNIIAFKPPMGIGFEINYEGVLLQPRKIWFLPLEKEAAPNEIGLKICIPNYKSIYEEKYLAATYQILDTLLGEKTFAHNVHHIEVDKLPKNPEKQGMMELIELPEYLDWKKSKSI